MFTTSSCEFVLVLEDIPAVKQYYQRYGARVSNSEPPRKFIHILKNYGDTLLQSADSAMANLVPRNNN